MGVRIVRGRGWIWRLSFRGWMKKGVLHLDWGYWRCGVLGIRERI